MRRQAKKIEAVLEGIKITCNSPEEAQEAYLEALSKSTPAKVEGDAIILLIPSDSREAGADRE